MTGVLSHLRGLAGSLADFFGDYAGYSGRKGLAGAVLVLLGAFFEGLGLALIAPLLGVLFASGHTGGRLQRATEALFDGLGASAATTRLLLLLSIFAVAMILRALVLLARDVTAAELRVGFVEQQRARVAEALASASWGRVVRFGHARVLSVMSGDIQQIGVAANYLTQCLSALVMLAVQCTLALFLSWRLAVLSFLLLVVSAFALIPAMRRARSMGRIFVEAGQDLMHGTVQFLGALKLAVSQNLQRSFLTEFRVTLRAQSAQQTGYLRQQSVTRLSIATLSALVSVALIAIGLEVFHVSPTVLVALLMVVVRMSGPSGQIQQGAQLLANALPAYEAVQSLRRDLEAAARPADTSSTAVTFDGTIRFERVSFLHPGEKSDDTHGVQDLSVMIEPRTVVGIKGPSGAGKTTFADLLVGLIPPQSGTITIGSQPLTDRVLDGWHDQISYVAQDPFLFNDTIRRNLAWANPRANEDAMWRALELVEASDFVRARPDGLDTVVGERGTLISGGERQRLALARGLLRKPKLLVLDEATNALDPAIERTVFDRLVLLKPKPTIVIISHRPESLSRCDRVLNMVEGRFI